MKKRNLETQEKESRSITQEMHQAFAEWMNKLPFMKRDLPKPPEREGRTDESSEKTSE